MHTRIERLTGLSWHEQRSALLVGFGHAGTHWTLATFYLVLPFVAKDLGLSYSEVGLLVTVLYFSQTVANFASGALVDITGRRVVFMILSLILGGGAFAAFATGPALIVLTLLVVLIGVSVNLWHPAAISYLSQAYATRKGYALSLHVAWASIADSLAPLVAGAIIGWLSWRGATFAGAMPALFAAVLLSLTLLLANGAATPESRRHLGFGDYMIGLRRMVTDRAVVALCAMSAFRAASLNGLYVFLPLYLADVLGLPPFLMGATMTCLQVGAIFGSPAAGIASDRMSRRTLMVGGLTVSTVLLIGLTLVSNDIAFIAGVSMLGFMLLSMRPVIQSWLMDLTPPEVGASATSLLFGFQSGMSALAPVVGGIIADTWGLPAVFYMLAGAMLVANLLVFLLPRRDTRRS